MGHDPFYDQDLTGGQRWWDVLLTQIEESDGFLPVLSDAYIDSEACGQEARWASNVVMPILPLDLGSVGPEMVDPHIAQTNWIRFGLEDPHLHRPPGPSTRRAARADAAGRHAVAAARPSHLCHRDPAGDPRRRGLAGRPAADDHRHPPHQARNRGRRVGAHVADRAAPPPRRGVRERRRDRPHARCGTVRPDRRTGRPSLVPVGVGGSGSATAAAVAVLVVAVGTSWVVTHLGDDDGGDGRSPLRRARAGRVALGVDVRVRVGAGVDVRLGGHLGWRRPTSSPSSRRSTSSRSTAR